MNREQRHTVDALALRFESLRVDERTNPVRVEACEWPDPIAPRIVATFTVAGDGRLTIERS